MSHDRWIFFRTQTAFCILAGSRRDGGRHTELVLVLSLLGHILSLRLSFFITFLCEVRAWVTYSRDQFVIFFFLWAYHLVVHYLVSMCGLFFLVLRAFVVGIHSRKRHNGRNIVELLKIYTAE